MNIKMVMKIFPIFEMLRRASRSINKKLASVKAKFISLQADALQIATKTIPPSLLVTTDEAFKSITFSFQQIPLAEIAKNCVKIKTDKWDICKRDGDEIIRYYHSNDGSDKQYWRYESKDANGIKCWITKESNLATYQYKVCLDGQATTSGTCEYKEIDIEVGKYTGEILADKLAYTTTRIAQYTLSLGIASSTTDILNSLIGESLVDLATTNPEILSWSEALITGLLVPLVNRKLPPNTAKLTELSAKNSVAFQEGISTFKSFLNRYKNKFNEFRAGILKWAKGLTGARKWLDDLDVLLGAGTKTKIKINNWISKGLSESKIETEFAKTAQTTEKASLLNKLEEAKSIYHQRVHIEDWDNIPGITKSDYISNGLSSGKSHTPWNNSALNLPTSEAANFVDATAVELSADTKIYRVTGGNPAGGYWTIQKPNSVGEVIGGTAVQPAWNDFSKMYIYEVPQGQTLKVWQGTTARQPIAQGIINPHLSGGDQQLFIPDVVSDNTFKTLVQQTTLPW